MNMMMMMMIKQRLKKYFSLIILTQLLFINLANFHFILQHLFSLTFFFYIHLNVIGNLKGDGEELLR